jgi:L-idonate 5-dehydrogenase
VAARDDDPLTASSTLIDFIMDALVIHAPGDLRVEDIATPSVNAGQVRVRVRAGGICGSDLHYYQHGGFGTIRIQQPMVLGHEVAGIIEEVAPDVAAFGVGDRIAVSPSRPCGACRFCQLGLQNHCLDMRYYGSAMRMPHVQGAFRKEMVIDASQAHRLADGVSDAEGAMAEPLAVALHAVNRAGPLLGRSVLVTGCGPIGAMVVIAARRAGAATIVATDVVAHPLRKAAAIGADETINVAETPEALARYAVDKGQFDVLFEASGNERALRAAFDVVRPRGVVVQLGLSASELTLPFNTVVAKEFDMRGAFRFHEEFAVAVELINKRLVDLKPLVSATVSYRDAGRAFALAADRSQAMKVLLNFD